MKIKNSPQPQHKQKPGHYQFVEVPTDNMIYTQNNSLPTIETPQSCSTCFTSTSLPPRDSDAIVFRD